MEKNKTKLRILIRSEETFAHFVDRADIEFDRKDFFCEGSDKYASPLSEYDLIIADIYNNLGIISETRKKQIIKHIESGKPFIYILKRFYEKANNSNYKLFERIFGTDYKLNSKEIGNKYSLTNAGKKSIFKEYLEEPHTDYKVSFQNENQDKMVSYAYNTEKNIVSFALKEFQNCYFLPWHIDKQKLFCEIVIELARSSLLRGERVDDWVTQYSFDKLQKANEKIEDIQKRIEKLEDDKEKKIKEKEKYERTRDTLLYRDGDILKDVCKEVINELGIEVEDGKVGREDLVFIHDDIHFVIEVKGTEKSANKKHIAQLGTHITEYKNENEVEPKGILLINPWRKLPLEERNTNDKPNFPPEIMKLVELSKFTLLTTQQLFVAYCEKLEGKFNKAEFIDKISSTERILEGYNDIEKYKIKDNDLISK